MSEHPFDRYAAFTDLRALREASARPLRKSKRVNLLKTTVERFKEWASEKQWTIEPVPWCAEAFFIDREDRETALGKDLLHLLGHTYMQEAASMLPAELLGVEPGHVVLDMAAAPGSKTTQIGSRLGGRGVVVANDVQEKRLWTLKSSLHRCGVVNNIVTKKVGQWFARHMTERFDRVLCDAPCTAQGTARKDSDALLYSSIDNVRKMSRLQKELLESAIDAAKVGGLIVYSTCTLTPEENEEVVLSVLQKFPDQLEVVDPRERMNNGEWIIDNAVNDSCIVQRALQKENNYPLSIFNSPFLRLWPQTYDTEGFFAALLRKKAPTRAPEHVDDVRFQEERLPPARTRDIGAALEERFGTPFLLPDDRLFERASQLVLATEEVSRFHLPVQDYALGIPFARRLEESRVRIDHDTVTLRGFPASRNVLDLDDATLDTLLDGKDAACDPSPRGDVLLRYRGVPVGTSLAKEGRLMNRLPRWIVRKS